ncbi:MAG: DUF1343 domain-containing protein [Verrucomicrobia bacterium]|nr:DUF1343 domain-containing protein [Verrucomicrobiota bacterium]
MTPTRKIPANRFGGGRLQPSLLVLILFLTSSGRAATFNPDKLRDLDTTITEAIARTSAPGAVLHLEHAGESYEKSFGLRAVTPAREPMTTDTIFDAASLTKVIATAPSVLLLVQDGRVKLDDAAKKFLPEFTGDGRDEITVRRLLTHTSGLRPDTDLKDQRDGYDTGIRLALAEKPLKPPGTEFKYSDINFELLGEIVQRASGVPLDEFAARRIFRPLKMSDTGFNPPTNQLARIAPTERDNGQMLRGKVHDPRARKMGGVAGHAGLFTTAADLSRFARMMLNGGTLEDARIFKPETLALMTSVQTPPSLASKRGLGWDIATSYSKPRGEFFPEGASFGHTGFTGTSVWIDPASKTFVILLTSRLYPDGKGNVTELRATVGTLAAEAVGLKHKNSPAERAATVLNGIDVLKREGYASLKKLRLGLVTNHTGHDRERNPTIDLLHDAPGVKLVALFSPEHGIRGALDQAKISDTHDEQTGLPVFSLYGVRRAPAPEQLADLDALVFDIQDIGCRFYTYVSTMGNCLEAAAKAGKKFIVLDRVNPIGGVAVEGPLHEGKSTFVAYHRVPLRHGLTVGELAQMFNEERGWNADLAVIHCEGWKRAMWFDETALPWTNPSPNMRSLRAATLYPGVGLLEVAISVGRGTDTPFELLGAPYVDEKVFAAELNRAGLDGIAFTPLRFTPTASTFKDKECGGVRMSILDREKLNSVDLGITLALTLQRLYGEKFAADKMKNLLENPATLEAIKAGKSLSEIKSTWAAGLEEFQKRRANFLIYE